MPQITDNQDYSAGGSPIPPDDEIRERRFQERNLRLITGLVFVIVVVALVLPGVLYFGHELPPWSMRYNQPADSTGYQTPPTQQFVVAGAVPRTGVPHAYPDQADGAVPAAAARIKNPPAGDPKALTTGKVVYAENCAFCHGVNGLGDGPAGESYIPRPPDLTNRKAQSLSAGTMYYKITNGILSTPIPEARKYLPREWHAFRGTISERDRWAVVSYIRSLRLSGAAEAPGPAESAAPMPPTGDTN
ncbi:MAG TPA: cytochrome c [Armatimonadota bacterium]|jgi:mono/diheme cytochrome c family protein